MGQVLNVLNNVLQVVLDWFADVFTLELLENLFRMVLSCVCGGAIGFERTKRLKEAGIRTHCIICSSAALFMLISIYGFTDLAGPDGEFYAGVRTADPARIAAQIVSGISFLGAGVIFKNGNSIKGLTTAAGIWGTAAVGMALGCGMYVLGMIGTIIIVTIQIIFHRFSFGNDAYADNDIRISVSDSPEFREILLRYIQEKKIQILSMKIEKLPNGMLEYTIALRDKAEFDVAEALRFLESQPGVHSISV